MSEQAAAEVFRAAGVAVPVTPPPLDAVVALSRRRRLRRTQWLVGGSALALVLAGAVTWAVSRGPAPLPQPEVVRATNPAEVPWYANRTLHLDDVEVVVSGIRDLVEVPDGVVYADRDGRVVLVDQQGRLTELGRTGTHDPITGELERGLVAWVDVTGEEPELVMHDTLGQREVGRMPVDDAARPVALDQERVYYTIEGESWSWYPPNGVPEPQPGQQLVDVASMVRAWQVEDGLVRVTQPLFNVEVRVPGVSASLTDDGDLVMTRDNSRLEDEVRIFVAGSGDELDTGLSDADVALAAAWGPGHTATYVVAHRANAPEGSDFVRLSESGPLLLRTCDLDTGECRSLTQISHNSGVPALPD